MDAGGNKATSATVTFKLPQRIFTDPLARALIELRQNLATEGAAAKLRTIKTLDALTYAPELFFDGKNAAYLAMRMALHSTEGAASGEDFKRIEDLLWQTAVGLEHGGLLTMAEQLRRLQAMIMQMMAQSAPQADIDAALQRYNDLMQRYLAALSATSGAANAEDRALLVSARNKLKFYDISDAQIAELEKTRTAKKTLTITAPISGFVVEKNIVAGQMVDAGMKLGYGPTVPGPGSSSSTVPARGPSRPMEGQRIRLAPMPADDRSSRDACRDRRGSRPHFRPRISRARRPCCRRVDPGTDKSSKSVHRRPSRSPPADRPAPAACGRA